MKNERLKEISEILKAMEAEVLDEFIDLREAEGATPKAKRTDDLVNQLGRCIVAADKLRLE